jgi:hypothetical protein
MGRGKPWPRTPEVHEGPGCEPLVANPPPAARRASRYDRPVSARPAGGRARRIDSRSAQSEGSRARVRETRPAQGRSDGLRRHDPRNDS